MADSIKKYYDFTIPQGEYRTDKILWQAGSYGSLTIEPDATYSLYVVRLKFFIQDIFAFGSGDEIVVTINAYDNSPAKEIVVASMEEIIAQGDSRTYKTNVFATWGKTHMVAWEFSPPIYLRSSTSPSETVVVNYVEVAGISGGQCLVVADLYNILESESGLS